MDEVLVRQEGGEMVPFSSESRFQLVTPFFVIPYIKISLPTSTAESYSKEYHLDCSLIRSFTNYAPVEHVFHEMDRTVQALNSTIDGEYSRQAGSKHKSYKIMKTKMFATLDKAKPDTRNTKDLNFGGSCLRPIKCLDCRCGLSY
jgi:hypothetical protein